MNEEELLKYLDFLKKESLFNEWFLVVKPILLNNEYQKRVKFKHHYNSVFFHCVKVSFLSYKLAYKLKCNFELSAIAGMLHDFYPYPWQFSNELNDINPLYIEHLKIKYKFLKKHGFTHASQACINCRKYFPEYSSPRLDNAILRHMFPLNIKLPKYKESWIVSVSDKIISIKELTKLC